MIMKQTVNRRTSVLTCTIAKTRARLTRNARPCAAIWRMDLLLSYAVTPSECF